jgi:hypothetical protein
MTWEKEDCESSPLSSLIGAALTRILLFFGWKVRTSKPRAAS